MAKRFIDTEMFDDGWFMKLPINIKLGYIYLITNKYLRYPFQGQSKEDASNIKLSLQEFMNIPNIISLG